MREAEYFTAWFTTNSGEKGELQRLPKICPKKLLSIIPRLKLVMVPQTQSLQHLGTQSCLFHHVRQLQDRQSRDGSLIKTGTQRGIMFSVIVKKCTAVTDR